MPVRNAVGRTTRDYLRAGTADSHDRLDLSLSTLLDNGEHNYAAFLDMQFRARAGIEGWLAENCSEDMPPPQIDLIGKDLAELGQNSPTDAPPFETPIGSDPLGVFWVLAGSSLGNRAILARLRNAGMQLPVAFLSDPQMTRFWKGLRLSLERPHSLTVDQAALIAAQATFAHFCRIAADIRVFEPA